MSGYSHATVSITATASQVFSANPSENDGVLVQNRGSVAVYLGGSTVTADDTGTGGLLDWKSA